MRDVTPRDPAAAADEVAALIRQAFGSAALQDGMRKPLEEGLMRAAEAVGLQWGMTHPGDTMRFLDEFQRVDEFVFYRN